MFQEKHLLVIKNCMRVEKQEINEAAVERLRSTNQPLEGVPGLSKVGQCCKQTLKY